MTHSKRVCAALAAFATLALPMPAPAEMNEVRIVRQFGIHYLPLVVMEDQQLVERRAKVNGIADLKVTWKQLSGGASVNDALLAHAVDFSAGGTGPLIVLWDKTKGGKGDVRGVAAVSDVPMTLATRNVGVKSIEDFTSKDKIALPAVKTSMQAVTLQMAAAKKWGDSQYERLDPLTVSMRHPDGAAAIMSGQGEVNSHFTAAPYDFMELRHGGIHAVLDSYDVYGGPATLIVLYATQKFVDENPTVTKSVVEGMGDAMDLINRDHRKAAEIYLRVTKEKTSLEDLVAMLDNPKIKFRLSPSNTYPVAEFLQRIGRIKNKPASWSDLFFPTIKRGS